jgi:hypothetical protein
MDMRNGNIGNLNQTTAISPVRACPAIYQPDGVLADRTRPIVPVSPSPPICCKC